MELLAIERELKGPAGMVAMEKYDRVLVSLGERLETALRAGFSPVEYTRAEKLRDANVVARKLLRLAVRKV